MAEDRMLSDEVLLALIKKNSGGGGGGTDDYNDLKNQPKINNNTLVGNKTASDLGLADNTTVQGILDGQEIDSFGDVETALAGKQDATDNNLDTDAKTIVGAINEHEGDISSLKSGFTNLDNEVNGDATTYDFADVITIEDAVPSNLADCSVKIEPVQDLHGYDKPWVGGAGKNKAYVNINSGETALTEIKDNDNNVIGVNADVGSAGVVFTVKMATVSIENGKTYTLSGSPNDKGNNTYRLDVRTQGQLYNNWNEIDNPTITATEDVTLDIYLRIAANYAVNNLVFHPQIEEGNQATTFAPYTNICPISGHTEASVDRVGKNLADPSKAQIYDRYIILGGTTGSYLPDGTVVLDAGTYTASCNTTAEAISVRNNYETVIESVSNTNNITFTLNGTTPIRLAFVFANEATRATTFQLEKCSSPTDYVPYAGKTYTIALGDTIYGGTVDFDSGVMTVTRGIKTYTGEQSENWIKDSTSWNPNWEHLYYISLQSDGISNFNNDTVYVLSNECEGISRNVLKDTDKPYCVALVSGGRDLELTAESTTVADFKTYLASNPLQVCYELATPTTIQLTPQQIQLLKGTNTLTASTGQISVTVNGVSGAIGAVQEQVNELAGDVAEIKPVDYSTTEQATGRKWLNDPTYIVVIDIGEEKTVTSNTWYTVGNHLGTDTIINGMGITGSGGTVPLQIVEDTTDGIKILQTRNAQVGVRYVWLEYTKTT